MWHMKKNNYKNGFVKEIFIIVIAIVILSYFGVNIRDVLDSESVKGNFLAVSDIFSSVWNNYILPSFAYLFDLLISLISKVRQGGTT